LRDLKKHEILFKNTREGKQRQAAKKVR